ncbi:MAG: sigma-54 dependent transcriptional regulator [Deltaproteobacteria bacterium]|nr:sigma-54 dependent transcriptional regulator [Deltaproteobacteria bacterium]MDL1960787.1 sigma-54 dependent transcriptional regulator [Deltaproteobacteria bacterium]
MRNESILVVDDAPEIRFSMSEVLRHEGFTVDVACDGQEAIDKSSKNFFDVMITDLAMPRKDGMEVLSFLKEHSPETICIIITGFGTIHGAVEAMRQGAFDYLTKPVKLEEVIITVDKALEVRELRRENRSLRQELRDIHGFERIVGASKAMQEVFELVEKVAGVDSTVLITGESGTGKELIAHALHYKSEREDGPFVPVNCAAIPEGLLESELFGHEKGSFTHAISTKIGRFELANKGTIFLDEIGEMSSALQVKLLRFLQERQFERVGGVKTIHVDARIIAATNIDLEEAFQKGSFRDDLYYRLNVIPIHIPPLRERPEDIPLLIQHFLLKFCSAKRTCVEGMEENAIRCLESYDWPGNVRELENIIERMVILSNGPIITVRDLPNRILKSSGKLTAGDLSMATLPIDGLSLNSAVGSLEKTLILQALEQTGWVKNRAAKLLQMNRTTLIEKMKKQNLMTLNPEGVK